MDETENLVSAITRENDRLDVFAKRMDERMSKLEDILKTVVLRGLGEKTDAKLFEDDNSVSEEVLKDVAYMLPSRKRSDFEKRSQFG